MAPGIVDVITALDSGDRLMCFFVPPYLLQHLAASTARPPAAASGRSTLHLDQRLRDQRRSPPPRLPTFGRTTPAVGAPSRVIHSADNTEELPGRLVRSADQPASGDVAVDEAHDSSAQVWDLFAELFGRRSVDGAGTPISVTVHYGQSYDNAFWDGQQLVFGDGDGEVFERFTKPMDVMAHEFAHGVTQFSAGLVYQGQSGALNESVSDVFAALTKQRFLRQEARAADWLVGEGLFRPGINATALRSMIAPGTAYDDPQLGRDPQVGSMADYLDTTEDNGGVHLNSGIPNRAFVLVAQALGGFSWERAGRIWYDALTAGAVGAETDFVGFAEATLGSARRLFDGDPAVVAAVQAGWAEVGVLEDAAPARTSPATGRPSATSPAPLPVPSVPVPAAPVPPVPVPVPAGSRPSVPASGARTVAVRRSGGFAGVVRAGELDLEGDPQGPQVRELLLQADLSGLSPGMPAADRFVYTLAVDDWQLIVPEQDLTPELDQVVRIVLGGSGRVDLG